jgi:hypothetical protein
MNSEPHPQPCRPITDEEIQTYAIDGVVCLRQVFDKNWIDELLPVAKRITADKEDFGLLPTYPASCRSSGESDAVETGTILFRRVFCEGAEIG